MMNISPKVATDEEDPQITFEIDRNIFTNEDQRNEDLHLQLSEKYMVYKDLADRCLINPTQIDKGDHRVFYIKPDSVFTQEPRIQNQFRTEFIRQLSAAPIPEPFTLYADDLHKSMLEDIRDKSTPGVVREQMSHFYQRRQFKLQHKRHKYLSRWAHFALTSELVDKVSLKFSPNFSKIQFELEQAVKRYQRLEGDDHFDSGKPRPQRLEPNGTINQDDLNAENLPKHCTLRIDDIDIYFRICCYEAACNKPLERFVNRAKWASLTHRFKIYTQTQERIQNYKSENIENQKTWQRRIENKGKEIVELKKLGERGFKELAQIKGALPYVKRDKKLRTNKDILLQSQKFNYDLPPMLIWNQVELKLSLEDLCRDFKIQGDMEVDDGNSFSYTVVVQFPTIFYAQMVKNQFAPYDAIPQVLNPGELGKQPPISENIKSISQQNSILDQLEIEKKSQQMNIQYLNQIEKALFGEFNNGQLEDFPSVRLRKTYWLPYVCFKAEISKEQMQQAALLANELNPVDHVIANMLEIININDITNINLTLESISQIHYDKLRTGKVRNEFLKIDQSETESIFNEQQKQFLIQFMGSIKTKSDYGVNSNQIQDEPELPKNSLFDTPQNLLLAQYLMTCLKAREHKTKLLYTLNAFRSIQKRIALELRELSSRDRVTFDCNVVQPKEKNANGVFKNAEEQQNSDETVIKSAEAKADRDVENEINDELIDINRYRLNGLTQTRMFSTCPVLPKYHVTFGDPVERQEVSTEFEVNRDSDPRKGQSQRLLGRQDFINYHESTGYYLVQDDFGINVMYDCTFADMRVLEQELVKVMSYFINKIEPMQDQDLRNVFPTVDRFGFVREIIIIEERYQRAKLQLVFNYLECYEHTCDTLEQQRLIQIIVDLMAKRPRINFAANSFVDSYETEIKLFETYSKLVQEFIKMQKSNEFKQNNDVREYLEKTYRLIYEQIDNKWQYYESKDVKDEQDKRKINALGVKTDEDIARVKELEGAKPGMFQAKQQAIDPRTFADMLGMPFSSLLMLMKEHHERDSLIKQSIHEHVSFIKLQEGYPIFFQETEGQKNTKVSMVPGGDEINLLEIYESLSQATKVAAICYQVNQEIFEVHRPDNGLVASNMELVTIEFLLAEMRAVKIEISGGDQLMQPRDLDQIEDSSIIGNPEKMLFFAKELIAAAEDPTLIQNPFILTKLDITTIQQFDFDAIQSKKFKKKEERVRQIVDEEPQPEKSQKQSQRDSKSNKQSVLDNDEPIVEDMPTTVQQLEQLYEGKETELSEDDSSGEQDDFAKKQKLHERNKNKGYPRLRQKYLRPNIPSMLEILCNSVEVLRLRSLLVEAYNQRAVLTGVYQNQCKILGQDAKITLKDQFNFETHMTGGVNWKNYVDTGPGTEMAIKTDLSIREFDPTLISNLNFSDPEAFKALICPLGLEELRAVVRYEILNLHALVIAVRHNQILLDTAQRQISEIELFAKGYLVTAPSYDIIGKLHGQNLFDGNLKRLPDQEKRKVQQRISENISKCAYVLIHRKNRPKVEVEKAYQKIRQSIIDNCDEKVEVKLRYLRTCRIMLCHDYCSDVNSSLYLDSVRVELLNEINGIRRRAYLLPRDAMVHKIPQAIFGEYTSAAYNEQNYINSEMEQEWQFLDARRQITDFWKIPSFYECCNIEMQFEDFRCRNLPSLYIFQKENQPEQKPDTQDTKHLLDYFKQNQKHIIKSRIPILKEVDMREAESNIDTKGRFVDYRSTFTVDNHFVYKYLFYFRQLQNLFDLEYFRSKLSSRSHSMAQLEIAVNSGTPFWEIQDEEEEAPAQEDQNQIEDNQQQNIPYSLQSDDVESQFTNKLAEQILNKIALQKKHKMQLITELDSLKDMFSSFAIRMTNQQLKSDLMQSGVFLSELLKNSYYNTMLGLIIVRDSQIKAGTSQKEIQSINEVLQLFNHTDATKITYNNGYHVNIAATGTSRIGLEENVHRPDYRNFFHATQPIIDEAGLNPTEFNLIQGMFTSNAIQLKSFRKQRPHLGWLPPRDFHYLDMKLFNLSRDLRKYIAANINQCGESSLQYALAYLRVDNSYFQTNFNQQLEFFNAMKQFTKMQIRSAKLKTGLMILMTKRLLPTEVSDLKKLYNEFQDLFNWKVVNKIDEITKHRMISSMQHKKSSVQSKEKLTAVEQLQLEISASRKKQPSDQTLAQFDMFSCEVDIYQREIMKFMILTSKRLIERETTSLAKAFEINGKRMEVLIHPQQQFAATVEMQTDKRNHLDIINKVSPLQKMLSQFRNRMLEIDTLTSGKGVIISSKDLNECLKEMSRSIVKNGEIEMRTRCEYLSLQIIHYENMVYNKDQQLLNLENKLKQAKDELNRIVNTRVFARGNQLIYELDHTNRQLRLVKDNVYLLEKNLKEQIRLEFEKDLEQARRELAESRKKFSEYQATLNSHIKADLTRNFNELEADMKRRQLQKSKDAAETYQRERDKSYQELIEENSHLLQGQAKKEYKEAQLAGLPIGQNSILNSKDLELVFKEMDRLKASEKEAREEVLMFQNLMRKQRMLQNFKWLIAQRKWDFKIDNLKSQLTSNATLWEQLAESEKREKILKQELQRTQSEVATLDRVLERLKDEVKYEQLEKHKLLKFQETKFKRLNQLEDMAKQMELMSNIDLDKLLTSVGQKDNKLKALQAETSETKELIAQIYRLKTKEVEAVKKVAQAETQAKNEAFQKMEELRAEMQLLQSDDLTSMNLWKDKILKLKREKSEFQTQVALLSKEMQLNTNSVLAGGFDSQKVSKFGLGNAEDSSQMIVDHLTTTPSRVKQASSVVQNFTDVSKSSYKTLNPYAPDTRSHQQINNGARSQSKVLPQIGLRMSFPGVDKKQKYKNPHQNSNVFDQLLLNSQSLNGQSGTIQHQSQNATGQNKMKPTEANFGFQKVSELNHNSGLLRLNPQLQPQVAFSPSNSTVKRVAERAFDVNIFSSLRKQQNTHNYSTIKSQGAQESIQETKYLPKSPVESRSNIDTEQDPDGRLSKNITLENILAPINQYRNNDQSRATPQSTDQFQSNLGTSQVIVSPFVRVPGQVGDRLSHTDGVGTQLKLGLKGQKN